MLNSCLCLIPVVGPNRVEPNSDQEGTFWESAYFCKWSFSIIFHYTSNLSIRLIAFLTLCLSVCLSALKPILSFCLSACLVSKSPSFSLSFCYSLFLSMFLSFSLIELLCWGRFIKKKLGSLNRLWSSNHEILFCTNLTRHK